MDFVRDACAPHQCTFVPDSAGQFTSDHGWSLPADAERLAPLIAEAQCARRARQPVHGPAARGDARARARLGADRVELYTETYARAHGTPQQAEVLGRFAAAARRGAAPRASASTPATT